MYTLQGTAQNPVQIEMENNIRRCFIADGALTKGTLVKLQSDGTVVACTAATDFPIGHVLVPAADEAEATVSLAARAVVIGVADGSVTCGNLVACDATGYKAWVAGNTAVGIALNTASDAAALEVALLYNPVVSKA